VLAFTAVGQRLSNQFETYRNEIATLSRESAELVEIAVFNEDAAVRAATRKFSLLGRPVRIADSPDVP
jgi:hypothetical protein